MAIHVEIPDALAAKVAEAAKSLGKSEEQVVIEAVATKVAPLDELNELLAPVRAAFAETGMTEDEAVEEFEHEKHSLRQERRDAVAG
ncbi:hypothetical protein [Botrimarina mediterranea]|uniref:Uncharacterized protein n=1 Tax=Botrimarina mediterranea TaxID=2528022 RepID=A0A518K7A0_9BACT|nr:hypothetical protein [Botrimarina mediterranea]QDV73671.1 hypothetical protein Spa11_18700 [Botrimarina mediterranea]QDV78261.1 hypothetical protein K2D_18680 [Planctomycetes bacterium K2D]